MPAKSQAQREMLNAKFGHDWVKKHGFDNSGPLPARVTATKGRLNKGSLPAKSKKRSAKRHKMMSNFVKKNG